MTELPTNMAEVMAAYADLKDDATEEKLAEFNRLTHVKDN